MQRRPAGGRLSHAPVNAAGAVRQSHAWIGAAKCLSGLSDSVRRPGTNEPGTPRPAWERGAPGDRRGHRPRPASRPCPCRATSRHRPRRLDVDVVGAQRVQHRLQELSVSAERSVFSSGDPAQQSRAQRRRREPAGRRFRPAGPLGGRRGRGSPRSERSGSRRVASRPPPPTRRPARRTDDDQRHPAVAERPRPTSPTCGQRNRAGRDEPAPIAIVAGSLANRNAKAHGPLVRPSPRMAGIKTRRRDPTGSASDGAEWQVVRR